ncbi:MAG TPA: hypothetical protein VK742_03685 [Candidatus Sulfotelmatobacter sp.]|jgi:hypothetical protein|nr:hypothetical protein [Candidatus Sulfotelmatobacter sp.]
MKTFEDHGGISPQTINECRRERPEPPPGHSKGGPDAKPLKNRISVRFATPLPEQIEIKLRPIPERTWLDQLWSPIAAWMEKVNQPIL